METVDTAYMDGTSSPTNFYSTRFVRSWPIIVRGKVRAHGEFHEQGQSAALSQLRALCDLLTLTTTAPWTVRLEPHIDQGQSIQLPTDEHYSAPADEGPGEHEIPLPAWLTESVFNRLEQDEKFADRILAFHEGVTMSDEHPSYANIAFVGVIEGSPYAGPIERCEADSCPVTRKTDRPVMGSAGRFRTALTHVLPEDDATRITSLYGKRSTTAHDGRVHGSERVVGNVSPFGKLYGANPAWDFFRLTFELRMAAQRLLIKEIESGE